MLIHVSLSNIEILCISSISQILERSLVMNFIFYHISQINQKIYLQNRLGHSKDDVWSVWTILQCWNYLTIETDIGIKLQIKNDPTTIRSTLKLNWAKDCQPSDNCINWKFFPQERIVRHDRTVKTTQNK